MLKPRSPSPLQPDLAMRELEREVLNAARTFVFLHTRHHRSRLASSLYEQASKRLVTATRKLTYALRARERSEPARNITSHTINEPAALTSPSAKEQSESTFEGIANNASNDPTDYGDAHSTPTQPY